jgi:hypothetical protein
VTGGCGKLHNEELRNLDSSPTIISIIKSKRIKWVRHVIRMEMTAYGILGRMEENTRKTKT